jgi:hypothetical protein
MNKIHIISRQDVLVWSKSFKAVLKKFFPNENSQSVSLEEISFGQVVHYTDINISDKVFIILDSSQDISENIDLLNGLISIKQCYIIYLSPLDISTQIKGFYYSSNFFEANSQNEIERINPYKITLHSKIWVELVNIGSFMRAEDLKNATNTICIAWCAEEMNPYKKLLASELQHNGYNVVFFNHNENEDTVLHKLKFSNYMIHLFGSTKSEKLAYNNIPADRFQMEITADYASKNKQNTIKRFIWEKPEKMFIDKENQAYLHNLASDKYLLKNCDYLKIDFSKFKTLIINEIKNKETEEGFALQHSSSVINILGIYQDNEDLEIELASKIKYDISPYIQLINLPDNYMSMRRFRAYLIAAEIVVLFYFSDNPKWLRSKLIEITKAPGYGRSKPWVAKYLLTMDKSLVDDSILLEDIQLIELNTTNFLHKLQSDIENYRLIERY